MKHYGVVKLPARVQGLTLSAGERIAYVGTGLTAKVDVELLDRTPVTYVSIRPHDAVRLLAF